LRARWVQSQAHDHSAAPGCEAREIAHAICSLLDDDAGYITGQIVRADGGGGIGA
jgi:NAD(P)-dependent dehydrogenase (short-subunit alcohol dehydrogenase family)